MTISIMRNNSSLLKNKVLKTILSVIIVLSIWEIAALLINDAYFLPDILQTSKALIKIISSRSFFEVVFTSVYRVFSGLFYGIAAGTVLAGICYKFDIVNSIISPIISIMKATPVACIIVLLWVSLNYTELAIFVVILMVLPIVWQNVYEGLKAVDDQLNEVTKVFELTKFQRLKVLVVPSVLSYLLPAIVTSVGLAWKAEVAAEIMSNSNMGRLIYDFKTVSYDTASIFAWTVIIVTLSIVFEKVTKMLFGRVMNGLKS